MSRPFTIDTERGPVVIMTAADISAMCGQGFHAGTDGAAMRARALASELRIRDMIASERSETEVESIVWRFSRDPHTMQNPYSARMRRYALAFIGL